MRTSSKVTLEILSAVLLNLGIANEIFTFGSPLLGIFSLIPHFIVLNNTKSLKESCFFCFFQSILVHLLSSFWLAYFKDFALFTLGASALGTGAISAFFGMFFYLPNFVKNKKIIKSNLEKIVISKSFKIIWFSAVYTAWEYVKCTGFLAYPWGTVSMSCYKLKMFSQIVDITGVRGITFLFCIFASCIAIIFTDSLKKSFKNSLFINKNLIYFCICLFLLTEAYGNYQFNKNLRITKHVNTIFIQQNYDPWLIQDDSFSILESQTLTLLGINEFKMQHKKPDLVIWSEAVLRYPFPQAQFHYSQSPQEYPLLKFIADNNIPTIIGAPLTVNLQQKEFSNSAIIFDKDANVLGTYSKIHLVPFAELIPFTEYEFVQKVLQSLLGFSHGWTAGNQFKVFDIPLSSNQFESVKVSTPICFEDAFPDIFCGLKKLGTELFVNLTDDSWSLTKSAEYQHFVIAWFRAIEFRTTLARSTNSGYTVVIDPKGNILKDLPIFAKSNLSFSIPIYENIHTTYLYFGEWLSYLCIIFILTILVFIILKINFCINF